MTRTVVQCWDGPIKPLNPALRYLASNYGDSDLGGSCIVFSLDGDRTHTYEHHQVVGTVETS